MLSFTTDVVMVVVVVAAITVVVVVVAIVVMVVVCWLTVITIMSQVGGDRHNMFLTLSATVLRYCSCGFAVALLWSLLLLMLL